MTGLWTDERGGVENVLYLILIAGIALVALPGVRAYTSSAETSFERSTRRYDRPGMYSGARIAAHGVASAAHVSGPVSSSGVPDTAEARNADCYADFVRDAASVCFVPGEESPELCFYPSTWVYDPGARYCR
jgi:hypothetical protein